MCFTDEPKPGMDIGGVLQMIKTIYLLMVTWVTLNASAYCLNQNPMANGERPHIGACAVDKINGEWVKFGTKIILPDGRVLIVKDRFGAGHDGHLDIWMPTESECWQFGRQFLRCRIEVE